MDITTDNQPRTLETLHSNQGLNIKFKAKTWDHKYENNSLSTTLNSGLWCVTLPQTQKWDSKHSVGQHIIYIEGI
jgi:hypothetical protein